ncbi:MAG: prepilin-type N-terminal cleavage/methylation domain-containing protein [Gemmatimonadaceae bacterium]
MLRRAGYSLVELLVAFALAAIVLGAATSSLLRQQRTHARILSVTDGDAQTRAAMLVLSSQLELLDPAIGDLAAGQADDSAMQFRAVVATSLACRTEAGAATLLPDTRDTVPVSGVISDPRPGDTLWWLADTTWRPMPIASVSAVSVACALPANATGSTHRLATSSPDTVPGAAPLRVTRQARFGIYRASDGTFQLGYREWNEPAHRFAAPQPVVGPLLPRNARRPSGFRYFDGAGAELLPSAGPIDVARIARIRLTANTLIAVRSASQDSVRADSVDVALRRAAPP